MEFAQALVSGMLLGSIYALMATGLTLVWGVMNIVNFAHGSLVMIAMYLCYSLCRALSIDPLMSLLILMPGMAAVSFVMYVTCIAPILERRPGAQMTVTFGAVILIQGAIELIYGPDTRTVGRTWANSFGFSFFGLHVSGPHLFAGAGGLLGLTCLSWLLLRTEFGASVRAVTDDREAARLMGIDAQRVHALVWALSGAMIGLTGALLLLIYAIQPTVGVKYTLLSFVIIALGGFGSIRGCMAAGLAIGLLQVMAGLLLPNYDLTAVFVLYLAVMLVRQGRIVRHA